jgi:transcriptional regulator with XRE-family HTH domain
MKNLKSLRVETGVSQLRLAEAIDSTQQAIHRYEHGDYEPDIQTMTEIANFFNTSVDYLVGNTTIRNKVEDIRISELSVDEVVFMDRHRKLSARDKGIMVAMQNTLLETE